jgi:hypothetical protein
VNSELKIACVGFLRAALASSSGLLFLFFNAESGCGPNGRGNANPELKFGPDGLISVHVITWGPYEAFIDSAKAVVRLLESNTEMTHPRLIEEVLLFLLELWQTPSLGRFPFLSFIDDKLVMSPVRRTC